MASGSFLVDRWWQSGHEALFSWERIVLVVVMYLAV